MAYDGDGLPSVEPVKVFENTYIIGPRENERFDASAAEKLMKGVLDEKMSYTNERDKKGRFSWVFDMEETGELVQDITTACHDKVKDSMGAAPRYKLIFQCSVGENNGQAIRQASRCLWDKETDNCATATWTNGRVYAVATCFALFFE
mmetsp:Transcript_37164/g.81690  ORF Transcript_37164/g.81690 Transcript_37164/m.81690 type:complete len:148 (+) Transcript_37164:120-563(+)